MTPSAGFQRTPLFGDHDQFAPVIFVPLGVLLALVQYSVVVRLRDANELTVVALCSHHAPVVQPLHGRHYAEAVAHVQLIRNAVSVLDLDVAVDQHAPRVQLLAVIHHHGAGLLDDREHHDAAQRPAHGQRHVGERLQVLGELEQHLHVVLGPLRRVLLQALPDRVPDGQALAAVTQVVFVRVDDRLDETRQVHLVRLYRNATRMHAGHGVAARIRRTGIRAVRAPIAFLVQFRPGHSNVLYITQNTETIIL